MTFHEKFFWLARERGLSPRAIALKLKFDTSAPAQWKRRNGKPSPEIAKQIADYFRVTVDELLDDTRELDEVVAERSVATQLGLRIDQKRQMVVGSKQSRGAATLAGQLKMLDEAIRDLQTLRTSLAARAETDE